MSQWAGWLCLAFILAAVGPVYLQQQQQQQQQQIPLFASDAYAMRHLRYSLRIRNFYWPKGKDPCTWRGVNCQAGQVVGIFLSGLKRTLVGMANPTLALDNLRGLPALMVFNATGFIMLGSLPDWFGQLPSLQVLDLSSCSVNGSIPSSFGRIGSLQKLSLAGNNLTGGLPSFSGAASLTLLDLSHNALTGSIPTDIGNLSRLQQLDMSSNLLTGPVPTELSNLMSLNSIDLSNNAFTGPIPADFGKLKNLRTLRLSYNQLTGSIPAELGGCSMLRELSLTKNSLNSSLPSSLGNLTNLTVLNLSFNNLTGFMPTSLKNLTNVRSLLLAQNLFYGPLFAVTGLNVLNVSNNYFNSSVPGGLPSSAGLDENCFLGLPHQRPVATCQAFYAARNLFFSGNESSDKPTSVVPGKKHRRLGAILGGVFGGVGALLLILLLVALVLCIRKYRRARPPRKEPEPAAPPASLPQAVSTTREGQPVPPVAIGVKMSSIGDSFSLAEIERATQNFAYSNFIKAGHSGDLYRGVLDGGALVVVKRIEVAKMKKDLLSAELEVFGKASHTRLVPLLGHCLEQEDVKFLVYKYMPNGDAAQALRKKLAPSPPSDILQSLDWITRLKIAIGAAEALTYLHHECVPPLVHRDIQASSILLDDKFEVRLGSLSECRPQEGEVQPKLITRILRLSQPTDQGEPGSPAASSAYDVYCYGKFLLELVTGRLDLSSSSPESETYLERTLPLIDRHNKDSIMELKDPSLLVDDDLLEEVWAMAIVAKLCLNSRASKRPQIRYVLKALENPQRVTREENFGSSLRTRTSSHSSWNASLFGSWRHSSSENVITPGMLREEYVVENPNRKQSGTSHSQGSLPGEQSFHRRPGSNEIFPEPVEEVMRPASIGSAGEKQQSQVQGPTATVASS